MQRPPIPATLRQLRLACERVASAEPEACDGALPACAPGAHVDVRVPILACRTGARSPHLALDP